MRGVLSVMALAAIAAGIFGFTASDADAGGSFAVPSLDLFGPSKTERQLDDALSRLDDCAYRIEELESELDSCERCE